MSRRSVRAPAAPAARIEPVALLLSRERRRLVGKARTRLRWGHDAEADELFARILETAPRHETALLGRVAVARRGGRPEEIIARCEDAAAVLPDRLDIRRHAVAALLEMKRLPEARRVVEAMGAIDRGALDTHHAASALARARGDRETALRHALAALRSVPDDARLALLAVDDLVALGRIADADEQLAPLLAAQPDSPELLARAGDLARRLGRTGEAVDLYARSAALRPGHVRTLLSHAEVCLMLGRDVLAGASLAAAWATAPEGLGTLLRLGNGFRLLGRVDRAREVLERACRLEPMRAEPWMQLSRLAARNGAPEAAANILRQARLLVGDAAPMLLAEASLLFGQGLAQEAEACFALAQRRHPEDAGVMGLALDRAIAMGRFATANELAARLPERLPEERARRHEALGRIAEARRLHAEARDEFQAAVAAAPGLAAAHEGLARSSLALLRPEEALSSLETALGLQAATLKLRGRMAAPTRGVLGELINEARIHAGSTEGCRSVLESGEWPGLLRAYRAAPDLTVLAITVLTKLRRQGSLDLSAPGPAAIPRRIHQYWNAAVPPPDVAELMTSWSEHNPGWAYRRYDLDEAFEYLRAHFPPEVARAFLAARQPAQQADLFRLAVLLAEGGVYADADDRCIAGLDPALAQADLLLWQEPLGSVSNSFIAAAPGHPVIEAALVQAVEATLRGDAETLWLSTGPGLLSRVLVQYLTGPGLVPGPGQRIVVLERWDVREFCMPCCKTAYKAGVQHWFNQEAVTQPG